MASSVLIAQQTMCHGAPPDSGKGTAVAVIRSMHVYLTARHFDLTEAIKAHVERRIVDTVSSHADAHDLNRLEVQLTRGQRDERFTCHVLIQLPGHREVNVTEHHHDMYAAIDLAEKRVLHSLVDLRERRLTNDRRPRRLSWRKIARRLRSSWGSNGTAR